MKIFDNYCEIVFESLTENIAFARMCVASFIIGLDPAIDELNELKTAVSEAVTNAIIHGYDNQTGKVKMQIGIAKRDVYVTIIDFGKGIVDVKQACDLFYTTTNGERAGMGLTLIEAFTDEFYISSKPDEGTTVKFKKTLTIPAHDYGK